MRIENGSMLAADDLCPTQSTFMTDIKSADFTIQTHRLALLS